MQVYTSLIVSDCRCTNDDNDETLFVSCCHTQLHMFIKKYMYMVVVRYTYVHTYIYISIKKRNPLIKHNLIDIKFSIIN